MTSPFLPGEMTSEERAQHGAALAKSAAFDAVYGLYNQRKAQGWTSAIIAGNVDVDEGWLSKQFIGPRNLTINSLGILVEGLGGVLEIKAYPIEELPSSRENYDPYAEYEEQSDAKPSQVPPLREGGLSGSPNDPSVIGILDMIRKNQEQPAPVPVA